ncbi:hypothetical protein [Amycolatopsis sp. NPDC098790]|uniref:hypothetical protein n=1 Tax=Amycolatopsis sp. NPDC098790 TaxID=3363939 RepID=UPI0038258178
MTGWAADRVPFDAGHALLRSHGVPERLARFAGTHGSWSAPDATAEDLLVSLADKVWKGKRVPDGAPGGRAVGAFMVLDDELSRIASEADARLAFRVRTPLVGDLTPRDVRG